MTRDDLLGLLLLPAIISRSVWVGVTQRPKLGPPWPDPTVCTCSFPENDCPVHTRYRGVS